MGSSSKKTKTNKDGKKRRHRSRSRSRSNSEDEYTNKEKHHRHRRHHHKDRRHGHGHEKQATSRHREYDSDGSDVIATSPQSQQQQQQQQYNRDRDREETPPPPPPSIRDHEQSPQHSKQNVESLSIDDTNKLRAKLGLKPLELPSDNISNKSDGKLKDDLGEFYHKPALNLAQKSHHEKLRTRLSEKKEKRHIESKLSKIKRLGDSSDRDSDDDTESWVEKNRRIQAEKEQARKRAKILEELDEEFGVKDIVDSELRMKKQKVYTDKSLRGLKVEHDLKSFSEGKSVILTLKDQEILAEEGADVLVNVNMIDDERYEKSNEIKKKRPGYQAYDEEFDEDGNLKIKSLLSKYDEEIDGEKKKTFIIGSGGVTTEPKRILSVKEKLSNSNKRIESLILPQLNIASEYYTEEEMTKFKKPKKRLKKLRPKAKVLTAAELAAQVEDQAKLADDHGSRKKRKIQPESDPTPKGEFTDWMDIDDLPEVKPIMDAMIKPDRDENDTDKTLERALHKARKLKQKEAISLPTNVSILMKEEPVQVLDTTDPESGSIILNATAEFCRSLGDIPTYGKAGNRDEDEDLLDFEGDNPKSESMSVSSSPNHPSTSTWNNIDAAVPDRGHVHVIEPHVSEAPILDEEPDVGSGVGAALKLAMSKGYLDKEENNRPSNSKFAHLQARHYSIEDKTYGDDDKFGGRRERYQGPTMDFKEKDTFRPNVKLEYIDDEGRVLNPKEAFRYLSHKFHGKGPGKNKIEKRIKKTEQEGLMKKMSSTDTPLGTLNMLQHKQKEMQSPYIVLSGSKHTHSTTISKARR